MEPVTLEDIKRHLVLDADDVSEDAYLASMIVAARRACELRIRQTVIGEERVLVLARFPTSLPDLLGYPVSAAIRVSGSNDLELAGGGIAAIEIRYYDEAGADQVLPATDYYAATNIAPAQLRPKTRWPAAQDRPDAVRVVYTLTPMASGDIDMVRHAIRLIVGHWYANREAVSTDGRAGTAELPVAVSWLLDPLRAFASS